MVREESKYYQTREYTKLVVIGIPALCMVFDVVILILQRITAPTSDPTYGLFHANFSFSLLVGIVLLSNFVLIFRYKKPLVVLAIQLIFTCIAGFIGIDSFFSLQLFIAFYTIAVTFNLPITISSGLLAALVMLVPIVIVDPRHPLLESFPRAAPVILIAAVGISIRLTREAREEKRRQKIEEQRSQILRAQRDAAVKRSEIAGELHDSVGHGLTTIISLSQGLTVQLEGRIDDPTVIKALHALTTIARESLEDTRTALRNLTATESPLADDTKVGSLHSWEDIRPVLNNARQLGVVTTLIETGRRAENPAQADLCFKITREAITNALRHANDLHVISVNWNHHDDGSMDVKITNDGKKAKQLAVPGTGTGLKRLNEALQNSGGVLCYGASNEPDVVWQVSAMIPSDDRAENSQ